MTAGCRQARLRVPRWHCHRARQGTLPSLFLGIYRRHLPQTFTILRTDIVRDSRVELEDKRSHLGIETRSGNDGLTKPIRGEYLTHTPSRYCSFVYMSLAVRNRSLEVRIGMFLHHVLELLLHGFTHDAYRGAVRSHTATLFRREDLVFDSVQQLGQDPRYQKYSVFSLFFRAHIPPRKATLGSLSVDPTTKEFGTVLKSDFLP